MADPQIDALDAAASDSSLIAYKDAATGQIVFKKRTDDGALVKSRAASGLSPATPEEIEKRKTYLKNTTAGAQAQAAAKLATNAATFGLAGFNGAEDKQQIAAFREQSPTLSALTEVAGTLAPAALGGGLAGGAMKAAGFAGRAVSIGTMVGEELAQSAAMEVQQAREQDRDIDAMNVIQGLPLAFGLSAASRLARGASRAVARPLEAGREAISGVFKREAAEGLEAAADEGANAISRGRATSKARRSVGAAAADDAAAPPMGEAEVKQYVDNFDDIHRETERLGGDAIEDALGGPAPAFDEVHSLKNKAADLEGKMTDANFPRVEKTAARQQAELEEIAGYLETKGQKQAAAKAREHAKQIGEALDESFERGDAVYAARAGDRAKQFGDKLVSKYGSVRGDITATDIAEFVNERTNKMRARLEKRSIYGQSWSDYQRETNKLWSGNDGIIASGKMWQSEFLERSPMGKVRKGFEEFPVFQARGDVVQRALAMSDREFERTLGALDTWADKVEKMTLTKAELGANTMANTPVMRLQQSVQDMRTMGQELKRLRETKYRGADAMARKAAEPLAKAGAEQLFETAKQVPGIGQALSTADIATKKITGRSIGERLTETKIKPARTELTREGARAAARARHGKSAPAYAKPPPMPKGGAIPAPGPGGRSPKPGPGAAPSLAGRSLADLKALPLDKADRIRVAALKKNPEFFKTGRVSSNDGAHGITLVDDGGEMVLRDGRHRFAAAQELGLEAVHGRLVDGATGKILFEGPIPLRAGRKASEAGSASVGAMATGAALAGGALAVPAITDALADISDDNRTLRERAAGGLVVKATRPRALPSTLERFKEGSPSLAAAYAVKLDDLQQALGDPHALVQGISEAYGAVADEHEDLYFELVQRTAMAAEYVLANAPPSVGISAVNPDGITPDTLALAQFAQTWSGAMNPGDVIYDVGTGSATPTQIKALREVHPDIYDALRVDVLKQVDRATMPFETLRQLDVLFDLPGASGPAFSADMTKTMQGLWKQPKQGSKGAASGMEAPESATAQFAAGPSTMR